MLWAFRVDTAKAIVAAQLRVATIGLALFCVDYLSYLDESAESLSIVPRSIQYISPFRILRNRSLNSVDDMEFCEILARSQTPWTEHPSWTMSMKARLELDIRTDLTLPANVSRCSQNPLCNLPLSAAWGTSGVSPLTREAKRFEKLLVRHVLAVASGTNRGYKSCPER